MKLEHLNPTQLASFLAGKTVRYTNTKKNLLLQEIELELLKSTPLTELADTLKQASSL